jgi:Leucine-rich repeat (LRR) protein
MITPAGTKQPMAVDDLARKTNLPTQLVFGCLARLVPLGFVRRVDPGDDGPIELQVWEVARDFLASLLSRILPTWKPSLGRHIGRWMGSALLAMGIGSVLILTGLRMAMDPVETWAKRFGGIPQHREEGGYAVSFPEVKRSRGCLAAVEPGFAGSIRVLELAGRAPSDEKSVVPIPDDLSSIKKLIKLETLTLRGFSSGRLPPEIGRLPSLTTLNFTDGEWASLPDEILDLGSLTTLDLSGNNFTKLPPEIGRLRSLTTLNLRDSDLTNLPPEIAELNKLSTLILESNGFTSLPGVVLKLNCLTDLNLHGNGLRSLPEGIGQLKSLTTLDVSYNRLTHLPGEITDLRGLQLLRLDNNRLESLPMGIDCLKKLEELRLHMNNLREIPDEIGELKKLRMLELSYNRLTRLPSQIGQLEALVDLRLHGNDELTILTPQISDLPALRRLFLAATGLTTLPPEMGLLKPLDELTVPEGLKDPPPDIVEKGPQGILDYLRQRLPPGPSSH